MKRIHRRLLRTSRTYLRWHAMPEHKAVHWLFLFSFAITATLALSLAINRYSSEDAFPTSPYQYASPVFSGKIVGVRDERILIGFREGVSAERREEILAARGFSAADTSNGLRSLGVYVARASQGTAPSAAARALLRAEPGSVEFAEPDYLIEPGELPDDPWFSQWQRDKVQANAPAAWAISTGSVDILVAIVDTGVDCGHEDLKDACLLGEDFYGAESGAIDENGHGTAVSGIAAASGNNGVGVAGGLWRASVLPLKVSGANGLASYSSIASAILSAADRGAKVVNNSYQSGGSRTVQRAAKYLWEKGGVLVVSEGNYGTYTGYSPSPYVVSVGAVDPDGRLYGWSSFGADVDVVAPGCTGASTLRGGGYGSFCGTSAAAPQVASALALIWAANPSLAPEHAVSILTSSAVDLGLPGRDDFYGWGLIDMGVAVGKAPTFVANEASPALRGNKKKP